MINITIRTDALSPTDFEKFSVDIVKKKLGNPNITTFAEGKDNGIDGADDPINPNVILQAKRWNPRKNLSSAITEIVKEIDKIVETANSWGWDKSFKYIIVTSLELSTLKVREVVQYGEAKLKNFELIHGSQLDTFSRDDNYKTIFENFGLLTKQLIELFREDRFKNIMDPESHSYFEEVNSNFNLKYFVETSPFYEAIEVLKESHMLILQGNPGVGKSTMCAMLGNWFCNLPDEEINVIKRGIDEIQEIKDLYNKDFAQSDRTLLVVFDDFLGQNTFEAEEKQLSKIFGLFSTVNQSGNLFVILNSRTQILNTAKAENMQFSRFIDSLTQNGNNILIDTSNYSYDDKKRILRKNFENVYQRLIRSEKNKKKIEKLTASYEMLKADYSKIVKHINFNPRLIEFISNTFDEQYDDYSKYILKHLSNPEYIYDEIFEKLSYEEKQLLFTICLFRKKPISEKVIRKSFEQVNSKKDFRIKLAFQKLEKSWLSFSIADITDGKKIGFSNPSVQDYLNSKILELPAMKNDLLKKSQYIAQIESHLNEEDFFVNLYENWDQYIDQSLYIGERILSLIKNGSFDYNKNEIIDYLKEYNGVWNWNSSFSTDFYQNTSGWLKIISEVSSSSDTELKKYFVEQLLFQYEDVPLLERILVDSQMSEYEINSLASNIESLVFEVYETTLEASNLIEGDEITKIDIIEILYEKKCEIIQEWLDGVTEFDLNGMINQDDYILGPDGELSYSPVEKILEYYSDEVEEKLTDLEFNISNFIGQSNFDYSKVETAIEAAIETEIESSLYNDYDSDFSETVSDNNYIDIMHLPLDVEA